MAHYRPMTEAQWLLADDTFNDAPLLDEEFDGEVDFWDIHAANIELANQNTPH